VVVPALIYLFFSRTPELRAGWAVPTATDIAFAVGVLALLGRSIPSTVRIFLLALAIIDDIAAVIIIALFYSAGLDYTGLVITAAGILLVLGLQRIGIGAAYAYVLPGAIVWVGLLKLGVHPTLAGVALGLMTPVTRLDAASPPLETASHALNMVSARTSEHGDPREIAEPLRQLRTAQRDLLPPVTRVQMALHPWVAYVVMPLFALANAGVTVEGTDLSVPAVQALVLGVALALVLGKPIGIVLGSWLVVRLGWCELPPGMSWRGVALVGCLGGIGFTMSIFIATLAFGDLELLAAAKAGVLLGSLTAGIAGLLLGRLYLAQARSVPVTAP
jgi:NhaA family Na+:H+ antiporter